MKLKEVYETYKKLKVPSLPEIRDTASEHSKTSLVIIILLVVFLLLALQYIPHYQVTQFNITNQKDLADAENSYRATLAQILGGVAIGIGLYYTWRRIGIAEEDLKATKEGQITERFTRAIDQLGAFDQQGNQAIEIRLGGIYALEKIANKSEEYYWPIMEILTAYIRKNSPVNSENIKVEDGDKQPTISLDIQVILTIIGKREKSFETDEPNRLDLQRTSLRGYYFGLSHLEWANLEGVNLRKAYLPLANLKRAILEKANLEGANLSAANLRDTYLEKTDLKNINLEKAHFKGTFLGGANLEGANLKGADKLTYEQLSKAKTLYKAQLDEGLEAELRAKGFGHLLDDEPEDEMDEP